MPSQILADGVVATATPLAFNSSTGVADFKASASFGWAELLAYQQNRTLLSGNADGETFLTPPPASSLALLVCSALMYAANQLHSGLIHEPMPLCAQRRPTHAWPGEPSPSQGEVPSPAPGMPWSPGTSRT